MYQVERTKTFKKDLSKLKITDKQYQKFIHFVSILLEGKKLPEEAHDHNLKGEWIEFREFHLGGDLLVIYIIKDDKLILVRIGTHSQLFK